MSRYHYRYAALIAQSKVCANRRINPSVNPRLSSPLLFNSNHNETSSTSNTNDGDMEGGKKYGALTHMDSAIAAHMMVNDKENESRNHSEKRIRKSRGFNYGADSMISDFQGNQLCIDAASLFADSERIGSGSSIDKKRGGVDRPDSSCVRPEIPSAALLNCLRYIYV
jgi:hypothetical protein